MPRTNIFDLALTSTARLHNVLLGFLEIKLSCRAPPPKKRSLRLLVRVQHVRGDPFAGMDSSADLTPLLARVLGLSDASIRVSHRQLTEKDFV